MKYQKTIIGSGFIAKNFFKLSKNLSKLNIILYAAGVSDSKTKSKHKLNKEYSRIKNYLNNFDYTKKLIYISSFSVFDPHRNKTLYIKNKIKIEKFIQKSGVNYLIIRLPEVVGRSKNKNTLLNFIYYNIKKNNKFILWKNTKRNIIDIDDAVKLLSIIIKKNFFKKDQINLISKYFYSIENIVKSLEKLLNKKALFRELNLKSIKWNDYSRYYIKNNSKKDTYLNKIIKKYY